MENTDITLLKPHSMNTKIYGEENIEELVKQIKESGWIKPILLNQHNTVISGHRRLNASLSLGLTEVPTETEFFETINDEVQRLLAENQSRDKTEQQKIREGLMWEEVIKEKAKQRMLVGKSLVENLSEGSDEKGATRDIVAKLTDIGDGKNFTKGKKIVGLIDKLKEDRKEKDAQVLSMALEESYSGAETLLKMDLSLVSEELKDKIINKEITAKKAIKEIKKEQEEESDNLTPPKSQEKQEYSLVENLSEGSDEKPITNEEIKEPQENGMLNITSNFEVDKDNFIKAISRYIDMEEQLSELGKVDKAKIRENIEEVKNIFNKIEDMLW